MQNTCEICSGEFNVDEQYSDDARAGEWLAGEVWKDAGSVCPRCLEIRTRLVMMYCHEINT